MSLIIETTGPVSILRMDDGENRFNPDTLAALDEAFDELERADGPRAAVLTGTGKFFSNGLDLEWMSGAGQGEPEQVVAGTQALLAKVLLAPMPVLAAVNGHAFAAGAMLALACDERVMRADRGYFCLPEVDIGLPFTAGMAALITARLAPAAAHRLMVTGDRVGGGEAENLGIVGATAAEDAVLATTVERAGQLAGKAGPTCAAIKAGLYAPVGELLRAPAA
ncbi:MAG TPA: enoyl-CoA hydratase/isomerase family protein [Thermoleophilaceae bacterium]|nr:enoyl-CoA hydratase/isomerase family protein [Thermoleophilaceae bacterium]